MEIKQFEDKPLSHYSYAILSDRKIALVDPERDPSKYYDFAKENNAVIAAIFETHPHADFISSHAEIHRETGAPIYVSKLLSAKYPYRSFDDGDTIEMGSVEFKAINTPGHSPDSICILTGVDDQPIAVFTGDTLFIGDCGRPDLRENAGAITGQREELARKMYHSLREKLMVLPDDVKVYPTHGAGSLCGRGLSSANVSTIGAEKAYNWSLQEASEADFVKELLHNQPFVPKYFGHSVDMNREGGPDFDISISNVDIVDGMPDSFPEDTLVIDVRSADDFKRSALNGSINIMEAGKLETWLGSIVGPQESFYLVTSSHQQAESVVKRVAKIGYESQIKKVFIYDGSQNEMVCPELDVDDFRHHIDDFTILDVRNKSEVDNGKIFADAVTIPLPELRERVSEISREKPIVVHCAGGYRSAAGMCIVRNYLNGHQSVYDLGNAITSFYKK